MNPFWRLFNHEPFIPKERESVNHIVENDMRFPITLEYANQGWEEGWLELTFYRIDPLGVEYCEYRHVYP